MADIGGSGLKVPPNVKILKLWTEQQIAEREKKIKHLEANAEEIIRGQLKGIEAEILNLKREVQALMIKFDNLEQFGTEEIVEIEGTVVRRITNQQGGSNG